MLRFCWDYAASSKAKEVEIVNRNTNKGWPFTEFEVGSRFFLRRAPEVLTPADVMIPKKQRKTHHISPSLQFRYTGPYEIIEKLNPLLNVAIINRERKTVHVFNMKRDAGESTLRVRQPVPVQKYTQISNAHQRTHYANRLPLATTGTQTDTPEQNPET